MHTARTIGIVLAGITVGALAVLAGLIVVLGVVPGLGVGAALAAVVLAHYGLALRPWHRRWGATDDEVHGPLPGDDLVPDGSSTTRAVAIAAPPEDVWPWLVQLGWGRAGWYSYDWIDNDGRPSADSIVPDWQDLAVGDRILMTPDAGFVVHRLDAPHTLVALTDDGSTSWCLRVAPDGDGSRLVSRFRAHADVTPATLLWWVVADPGVFVMERKMLRGIAARAEARHAAAAPVVPVRVAHPHHDRRPTVHPEDAEAFLEGHRIAVVGASDDRGNMGGVIAHELWLHGHDVVPVHPTAAVVAGHECHRTIGDVAGEVDGAVIVVPAPAAVDVVRQCIAAGVGSIWLFKGIGGEGAVSDEAVDLCRTHGVAVVAGACPLMFLRPVGSVHRFHRAARRARGTLAHQAG